MFLGLVHGLVLLPVLLVLFGGIGESARGTAAPGSPLQPTAPGRHVANASEVPTVRLDAPLANTEACASVGARAVLIPGAVHPVTPSNDASVAVPAADDTGAPAAIATEAGGPSPIPDDAGGPAPPQSPASGSARGDACVATAATGAGGRHDDWSDADTHTTGTAMMGHAPTEAAKAVPCAGPGLAPAAEAGTAADVLNSGVGAETDATAQATAAPDRDADIVPGVPPAAFDS